MTSPSRYELLEKIASGSFATVYRGRDLELGREVAIKQIHEQYLQDPKQLERYWQEAQLLASFHHPNIVTIFDVVRERGWLILELMQSDLSRVAGRKQMDLGALRTTLAHSLRALKFLHAHGIVHGDIKPSNMMIDRRRRVKIGDFGLARRVSNAEGSLIKGTTKYMAPEVVSDEFGEVGPASDLYSLGFAAYELMCGENFESLFPGLSAYGRDRQMAWMMWHAAPDRRLPEIQRVLADVPADLAQTIQKLIAKPQSERYRNADEALSDLKIDIKLVKTGEESVEGLGRSTVVGLKPRNPRRWLAVGAFVVSVAISLAALLLPSDSSGPTTTADADKPLLGVIREVLVDSGKLVIEDEHGVPEELEVPRQSRIRLTDEKNEPRYVLFRELKPQDRVEIRLPDPAKAGSTLQVTALRPVAGHGSLKSVDPQGQKLVAHLEADPHPQDVPMHVPPRARLILNGKPAELASLLPGDRIEIVHIKDTEGRAARDVIRLDARRSVQLTGFVRELKAIDERQWLMVDRFGAITPIELADGCRVTVNGQGNSEGKEFTPADLRPGDRVLVTHDAQITGIEAERRDRKTGVLLKIDPSARELFFRADDGTESTFEVDLACRIFLKDQPAALDELKKFDKLEVTFDPKEEGLPVARTLDALRPKGN